MSRQALHAEVTGGDKKPAGEVGERAYGGGAGVDAGISARSRVGNDAEKKDEADKEEVSVAGELRCF